MCDGVSEGQWRHIRAAPAVWANLSGQALCLDEAWHKAHDGGLIDLIGRQFLADSLLNVLVNLDIVPERDMKARAEIHDK